MPIFDTFTKQIRRQMPKIDIFIYDELPQQLRNQIMFCLVDLFDEKSEDGRYTDDRRWKELQNRYLRECGVLKVNYRRITDPAEQIAEHILQGSVMEVLDLIQLAFGVRRDLPDRGYHFYIPFPSNTIVETVAPIEDRVTEELNIRFREHNIGYQISDGAWHRVDSEYSHHEIVKPALNLLARKGFEGPNEEFRKAHELYTKKEYKLAVVEANKAFESTMKAIAKHRKWQNTSKSHAAGAWITVMIDNELIPKWQQDSLSQLAKMLGTLPSVRNNDTSSHGQGAEVIKVEAYMAAYALHLAAANIVMLCEADKVKK